MFVCFVLEHLARPADALDALRSMLKPGGTITVIEGDHGSAYFHPDSEHARKAIQCQVALQAKAGGDALIGRRLYPLLRQAGFGEVQVSPRMVYADASKPELVDGFTRKTFTAMIEAVRGPALEAGLITAACFDKGIADLYRTAEDGGVFCYTFFKARAVNPARLIIQKLPPLTLSLSPRERERLLNRHSRGHAATTREKLAQASLRGEGWGEGRDLSSLRWPLPATPVRAPSAGNSAGRGPNAA